MYIQISALLFGRSRYSSTLSVCIVIKSKGGDKTFTGNQVNTHDRKTIASIKCRGEIRGIGRCGTIFDFPIVNARSEQHQ